MKRLTQHRIGSAALEKGCKIVTISTLALALWGGAVQAATVTVTNIDDGVSNIGAPGTLYWAITNCNAGDTIAFNIDATAHGAGPYYFKGPPPNNPPFGGGFPLIYRKHNLLIDGYTQPGTSPNTHSITQANNAVIKIVIDGRDGGSRGMDASTFDGTLNTSDPPIDNVSTYAVGEDPGYGNNERSLLGIYRSTNVWIRGLAFLSTFADPNGDQKGICFMRDYDGDTNAYTMTAYVNGSVYQSGDDRNGHVSGCWFGVDPANPTPAGASGGAIAVTNYRHREKTTSFGRSQLPNVGLVVGVAPGSPNPRAEFNVFVDYAYVMDSENLRARFSGNVCGVMPDGVTPFNITERDPAHFAGGFFEWGRYDDTVPMIIGTDGDGVNDADEGNVFGPLALVSGAQQHIFDFYSTSRKAFIIAGNRFGVDINGTPFTNCSFAIGTWSLDGGSQIRLGSDFNGVSDALEANIINNNHVFAAEYPTPATAPAPSLFPGMNSGSVQRDMWVSVRGNVFVNNFPTFNPDDPSASKFVNWWSNYVAFAVDPPDPTNAIPLLSPSSTITTLTGTFAPITTNGYTNLVLDVYVPDPEGQSNGAQFNLPSFGGLTGWGFVQGKTYLGSYVIANPASGNFSVDISGLGLAHGTKVTVAVTYSTFARPNITSISHAAGSTTLAWTGDNGGPFVVAGSGSPSGGFGVQRASIVTGPYTTVAYAPNNATTIADAASTSFYRIVGPVCGMTTLCAPPVTLP